MARTLRAAPSGLWLTIRFLFGTSYSAIKRLQRMVVHASTLAHSWAADPQPHEVAHVCNGISSAGIRDVVAKADFVQAYFSRWDNDLDRAKTLLASQEYYLEAILVLSCHIGALASLRFPTLADNAAFKRVVLEYSGMRNFYEQIDLLFFLHWPRSEFSSDRNFVKLKNYGELAKAVEATFGDENTVRNGAKRYVSQQDFLAAVSRRPVPGFDQHNLQLYLPLFSNSELLYRYVRCRAVHSLRFPFVTRVHLSNGGVRYDSNHAITGDVLYQTALGVLNNLRTECLRENKWPWEL